MGAVTVRPRARIDLDEIWDFIAQDSVTQADAFIGRMSATIQLLAQQPDLGRLREDLSHGVRSFPFERYVVFYLPTKSGVELVRVLHGARDVEALLRVK
ncbi:type II toxin-antitoxin system RelE/ParE family toxin [Massilia rubra]|uniref:Toxin n=1 Tax=Massilia rubra TaxID=2607910 RepID=A0ABX0LNS0_9BURK|nr:type II toxin-antitoxin system RelE/ParE family toxin [Massilia rubra]NHZ34096.1 type II toxin-antitoxin system RelE/ParE family toxin [Massilia rubra]